MIIEEHFKFEVAEKDLDGTYTWHKAIKACPKGWRLPTLMELDLIYTKRDTLNMKKDWYWSSTESDYSNARLLDFNYGNNGWDSKDSDNRVRCVRDVVNKEKNECQECGELLEDNDAEFCSPCLAGMSVDAGLW